jgi:hypothetical protein
MVLQVLLYFNDGENAGKYIYTFILNLWRFKFMFCMGMSLDTINSYVFISLNKESGKSK